MSLICDAVPRGQAGASLAQLGGRDGDAKVVARERGRGAGRAFLQPPGHWPGDNGQQERAGPAGGGPVPPPFFPLSPLSAAHMHVLLTGSLTAQHRAPGGPAPGPPALGTLAAIRPVARGEDGRGEAKKKKSQVTMRGEGEIGKPWQACAARLHIICVCDVLLCMLHAQALVRVGHVAWLHGPRDGQANTPAAASCGRRGRCRRCRSLRLLISLPLALTRVKCLQPPIRGRDGQIVLTWGEGGQDTGGAGRVCSHPFFTSRATGKLLK